MNQYNVIVTDNRFTSYVEEEEILRKAGASLKICHFTDESEFTDEVFKADALLVNLCPLGKETISRLPKCRVISRYGIGYDNVDVDAATRSKIWVANVPEYCTEEASDHALALLLDCIRRISFVNAGVRKNNWNVQKALSVSRIRGKTFGLIGYGKIAQAFHRKIKGFMAKKILVCDPYVESSIINQAGAYPASFEKLLAQSDFISIHVPLTGETKGFIGEPEINMMKKGVVLINTARGSVIDEKALVKSLAEGKIGSAGLDVFEKEPPGSDNPLLSFDNVVLTSHMAYYSDEAMRELKVKSAENVASVFLTGKPVYPVNSI